MCSEWVKCFLLLPKQVALLPGMKHAVGDSHTVT